MADDPTPFLAKWIDNRITAKTRKLQKRVDELETALAELGAWIAAKRRAEAQAAVDLEAESPITRHSEEGEEWLTKRVCCPKCGAILIRDAIGYRCHFHGFFP